MPKFAKTAVASLALLASTTATGHAQYYNYYGSPNPYSWSTQNYPGYQTSASPYPWYYYYPGYGYGYAYNYPTYNYYAGSAYPAPRAFWDPYVAMRPYSDNAGPKASGHGSP